MVALQVERMKKYLNATIEAKASDLHVIAGQPPILRIDGNLQPITGEQPLTNDIVSGLVESTLRPDLAKKLSIYKEIDYSFDYDHHRYRGNAYYEKGSLAGSFRLIPSKIPALRELNLPPILERFTLLKQGFVIVTGPTGHGKSTTLASMVDAINQTRKENIITIEDPIEYVFAHSKSVISQRELGVDTDSFARALRSALREDPDVIFVGEMRDLETIEAALTLAETGHLVFTTLHTNDAAQAPDRIINIFPGYQQVQVRMQLANTLSAILSQRLLPRASGGRIPAMEILVANGAVKSLIREGKTYQLYSVIDTSAAEGMISMDKVLADLVSRGEVSMDDALPWVRDQRTFKSMIT